MKSNAFWKKLREYFGIYLPKQRNSSEKTIDSCRMAWNILLRFFTTGERDSRFRTGV